MMRSALRVLWLFGFGIVAVSGLGCETMPLGGKGAVVRDQTPATNKRIVIDETTVPSKTIQGDLAAPAPTTTTPTTTEPGSPTPTATTEPPRIGSIDIPGAGPEYKIQAGDTLEFQSINDEMLNRPSIMVRPDGYVSLPFVPDMKVQGLTRAEVETMVREAYKPQLKDPQISVGIVTTTSMTFYVLGDVQAPNEYPYAHPITVLSAITRAGGLRTQSNGRGDNYISPQGQLVKAFLIRNSSGAREVFEIDLRNLIAAGPHPSETMVIPGDIVFVPEGLNLVYLLGEVRSSSTFLLREGMTLLQMLAVAGGPSFSTARLREVVLMRNVDPEHTRVLLIDVKRMLRTGEDVVLKPGDMIYVPRKRLVTAQETVGRITGTISPVLNLYQQAYDTYYTKDRFDAIFNSSGGTSNLLGVLQGLRDFSTILPTATTTTP